MNFLDSLKAALRIHSSAIVNDIATHLRVGGDLTIKHQGWLYKRGHIRKSWKRRYFVLCSAGLLLYMRDDTHVNKIATVRSDGEDGAKRMAERLASGCEILGSIVIVERNFEVKLIAGEFEGYNNVFTLVGGADQRKLFYISASSNEEVREWESQIRASCASTTETLSANRRYTDRMIVEDVAVSDDYSHQQETIEWDLLSNRRNRNKTLRQSYVVQLSESSSELLLPFGGTVLRGSNVEDLLSNIKLEMCDGSGTQGSTSAYSQFLACVRHAIILGSHAIRHDNDQLYGQLMARIVASSCSASEEPEYDSDEELSVVRVDVEHRVSTSSVSFSSMSSAFHMALKMCANELRALISGTHISMVRNSGCVKVLPYVGSSFSVHDSDATILEQPVPTPRLFIIPTQASCRSVRVHHDTLLCVYPDAILTYSMYGQQLSCVRSVHVCDGDGESFLDVLVRSPQEWTIVMTYGVCLYSCEKACVIEKSSKVDSEVMCACVSTSNSCSRVSVVTTNGKFHELCDNTGAWSTSDSPLDVLWCASTNDDVLVVCADSAETMSIRSAKRLDVALHSMDVLPRDFVKLVATTNGSGAALLTKHALYVLDEEHGTLKQVNDSTNLVDFVDIAWIARDTALAATTTAGLLMYEMLDEWSCVHGVSRNVALITGVNSDVAASFVTVSAEVGSLRQNCVCVWSAYARVEKKSAKNVVRTGNWDERHQWIAPTGLMCCSAACSRVFHLKCDNIGIECVTADGGCSSIAVPVSSAVSAMCLSLDGKVLVVGTINGEIVVRDNESGVVCGKATCNGAVKDATYVASLKCVVAMTGDREICTLNWDDTGGVSAHSTTVVDCAIVGVKHVIGTEIDMIVGVCTSNEVGLWDVTAETWKQRVKVPQNMEIHAFALCLHTNTAYVASSGELVAIDLNSCQQRCRVSLPYSIVDVHVEDNYHCVVVATSFCVYVFDVVPLSDCNDANSASFARQASFSVDMAIVAMNIGTQDGVDTLDTIAEEEFDDGIDSVVTNTTTTTTTTKQSVLKIVVLSERGYTSVLHYNT